jgi:hypothetical protein
MKRKKNSKRRKTDREVLQEIFPQEIVSEVDTILREVDSTVERRENPSGKRSPKPWGKKWTEEKKRETE